MELTALSIAASTSLTLWTAEEYLDLLHYIHSLGLFDSVDIADLHGAMLAEAEAQGCDPRIVGYGLLREASQQGIAT